MLNKVFFHVLIFHSSLGEWDDRFSSCLEQVDAVNDLRSVLLEYDELGVAIPAQLVERTDLDLAGSRWIAGTWLHRSHNR